MSCWGCGIRLPGRSKVVEPASPKPPATQSLADTFVIVGVGLKLRSPEGWGFVEHPDYVQAECRPRATRGDLPVILVQADSVKTDLTLSAIVSGFTRQIPKGIENPSLTRDETLNTHLAKADAYQVGFRGRLNGKPVEGWQVLIKRDRWLVVITCLASKPDYAAVTPDFERFVSDLSW